MTTIKSLLASLNKSHIMHSDIQLVIAEFASIDNIHVRQVGESFEKRSIHLLSMGQGPMVIFAWTQMHGNEATATAAVFDLIYQLVTPSDNLPAGLAHNWQQTFTLHILPMLNPDGAQRCIRQNAQGIDINRDAKALQTPEGRLLMSLVDTLKPDIGFNLHDQSPYYQCGLTGNPATIAFLAPAFDTPKTIDYARQQAMQIVKHMNCELQTIIPNCIARYDDTYSHRSFGDNIAAKQVSTILIESGSAVNDPDRQIARQLNVKAILSAMDYLTLSPETRAASSEQDIQDYFCIPENISEALSSLLLCNLGFVADKQDSYKAGISIKQSARYSDYFFVAYIGDLGDQAGLQTVDCEGLYYKQGRCFEVTETIELTQQRYKTLLAKGYQCFYAASEARKNLLSIQTDWPISWAEHNNQALNPSQMLYSANGLTLNQPAYFLLERQDKVVAAVLNGRYVRL